MKQVPPDSPSSFTSFIALTSEDLSPNDQEQRMTPRPGVQWEPPSSSDISRPGSPALKTESQTTSAMGSQGIWKKHEHFYLEDGNVVFRVERTLYCVHRHFFKKHSQQFALDYDLSSESTSATMPPIHLENVETRDFEQLLSIFYPSTYLLDFPETKTVSEWTSILLLATKWAFTSLRELAIQRLFGITSPVEKIVLAHTFTIPDWLPNAYADLCKRGAPLTIDEGRDLFKLGEIGCDVVINLNQASYEWRTSAGMFGMPVNVDSEVGAIVRRVFQIGPKATVTAACNDGQVQQDDLFDDILGESDISSQPAKKVGATKVGLTKKKGLKKGIKK